MVARGLGVSISDPIVARSFAQEGVVARRLSVPLKLTYGFLVDRAAGTNRQIGQMAGFVIDALQEIGGDFVSTEQYGGARNHPIFASQLARSR